MSASSGFLLAIVLVCTMPFKGGSAITDSLLSLAGNDRNTEKQRIEAATQALELAKEQSYIQGETDALLQLGELNIEFGNLKKAIEWQWEAQKLAAKADNEYDLGMAHNNLGMAFYRMGELDSSAFHFKEAVNAYIKSKTFPFQAAQTTQNLGMVFHKKGSYKDALAQYTQAVQLFEKEGAQRDQAIGYHNMALVHQEITEYHLAQHYYHQSTAICREIKDTFLLAAILDNQGLCFSEAGNTDSAIYYHLQALPLHQKSKNSYRAAIGYTHLAEAYAQQGVYKDAQQMYRKALSIQQSKGYLSNQTTTLQGIGNLLYLQGALDSALYYADRARSLAEKTGSNSQVLEAIRLEVKSYLSLKNDTHALKLIEQSSIWQDSLFGETKIKAIAEAEKKYQTERAKQELKIEKLESQLKTETIGQQQSQILLLVVAFVLILIASILLGLLFRQQRKSRRIIADAREELKLLYEDATHRWSNFLMEFKAIYGKEMRLSENPKDQAFYRKGLSRIQAMMLIQQSVYQQNQKELTADDFFPKLVQALAHVYGYSSEELQSKLSIASIPLNTKYALTLGSVLTELVSNAMKYGRSSDGNLHLDVAFFEENGYWHLKVGDNGAGFDPANNDVKGSGLGLNLAEKQIQFLKGQMQANHKNGLQYSITLPISSK